MEEVMLSDKKETIEIKEDGSSWGTELNQGKETNMVQACEQMWITEWNPMGKKKRGRSPQDFGRIKWYKSI